MDEGRGYASQEKENKSVTGVDMTVRVQTLWPDHTPL